jgi:hypothetical protein
MMQNGDVEADAVWDSNHGLAAEERKAGVKTEKSAKTAKRRNPPCRISSHRSFAKPWPVRRPADGLDS